MCVSYFGIVTYQFEETFEFLYLVVGYGGFGLIGINQQVVGGGVVLVVQRGYFSYEVYCTGPGLRIVVRTYFREVVAECEIGVFIFFQFLFHLFREDRVIKYIDTQQVFFLLQMKHFQFLIVEVCQYSVCIVDFNAYRKMLIDVVQELFALSQHLCSGRHIRTVLYFGYAVNLGLSVFIGFLHTDFAADPCRSFDGIKQIDGFIRLLYVVEGTDGSMRLFLSQYALVEIFKTDTTAFFQS